LRAAAVTEPGQLRIIGALLVMLVVAFGAVAAWQVAERSAAAADVVNRSEPLSYKADEIYRLLADADTTAAGGFLAGGQEPKAVRSRYELDIKTASTYIADAATNAQGSPGRQQIQLLNQQLPVYTGLVETARTDNRQGLPLGGAYLRYASKQMRDLILPAARRLYEIETSRLGQDYTAAKSVPWAAWGLGALALGGLVWAQRRMYHRTNRVFNQGLLAGSAATAVVLLWLVAAHTVARTELTASYDHGAKSLQVLNQARISALQARGDENLTLVARGAGAAYNTSFDNGITALAGTNEKTSDGGLLGTALALADNQSGRRQPVRLAMADVSAWRMRHDAARQADLAGEYNTALAKVIGGKDQNGRLVGATETTGYYFDALISALRVAADHEHQEFQSAANSGRGALTGLGAGAALLALLGAACAVLGIGRRLSEYK
jgi:hypothetical protein